MSLEALREFAKSYRTPLNATILFMLIVILMLLFRLYDRSLAVALQGNSNSGSTYADLLSQDKLKDLKKNDVSDNDKATSKLAAETSKSSTSDAFTITPTGGSSQSTGSSSSGGDTGTSSGTGSGGGTSTGGGTSGGSGSGGNTTPPPTPPSQPFSASIDSFKYLGSTAVTCPGGGTQIPNCYKTYNFSATIKAQNGPGMVMYAWQSNVSWANETAGFGASAGESFTPLMKSVNMPCTQPGPLTLRLQLQAPTPMNSSDITIVHAC